VAFDFLEICAGKCSQYFRPVKTTQDSKVRVPPRPKRTIRVLEWFSPGTSVKPPIRMVFHICHILYLVYTNKFNPG